MTTGAKPTSVEAVLDALRQHPDARPPPRSPTSPARSPKPPTRTGPDLTQRQAAGLQPQRQLPLLCRTQRGRDFFQVATEAVFATVPANLSLLHVLFYAASGGSLEHLITTVGGAQQDRVRGGMGQLAGRLAAQLGSEVVCLGQPVRAVAQDDHGVQVVTDAGERPQNLVLAELPPTMWQSALMLGPVRSRAPFGVPGPP